MNKEMPFLRKQETASAKILGLVSPELRQRMPCAGCYKSACQPKELTPNVSTTKGVIKPGSSGCWRGDRGESRTKGEISQESGIKSHLDAAVS